MKIEKVCKVKLDEFTNSKYVSSCICCGFDAWRVDSVRIRFGSYYYRQETCARCGFSVTFDPACEITAKVIAYREGKDPDEANTDSQNP